MESKLEAVAECSVDTVPELTAGRVARRSMRISTVNIWVRRLVMEIRVQPTASRSTDFKPTSTGVESGF